VKVAKRKRYDYNAIAAGMTDAQKERFWSKVEKTNTCWLWTGTLSHGYGKFTLQHTYQLLAHRLSVALAGRISNEANACVDHRCLVTTCIRPHPEHVEDVTYQVNLLRGQTIPARNALKTHCPKGHLYSSQVLMSKGAGRRTPVRICQTCRADAFRRYHDKHPEARLRYRKKHAEQARRTRRFGPLTERGVKISAGRAGARQAREAAA
jgi:hypothetical protein